MFEHLLDELFQSVDEEDVPVVIVVRKVPGSSESLRVEEVLGVLRPVEVAEHRVRVLDADLADFVRTADFSGLGINKLKRNHKWRSFVDFVKSLLFSKLV